MVTTISIMPPAPSRSSQSNEEFVTATDAFLAAIVLLVPQINTVAAEIQAVATAAFSGASASSVLIGTGAKSFTATAGMALTPSQTVILGSAANSANFMTGTVTSYNAGTGALVVNVTAVGGSGTHADWRIGLAPSSSVGVGSITGLGTNVAALLASFSSANIAAACGDETGAGSLVFGTGPTIGGANLNSPAIDDGTINSSVSVLDTGTVAADSPGYRGVPTATLAGGAGRTAGSAITLILTDAGKRVPNTAGGWTIPANASVAFPIDTVIMLYNNSASNQTITITTDTLRQFGTANTGSRTLAQRGSATLVKLSATEWGIAGSGVS